MSKMLELGILLTMSDLASGKLGGFKQALGDTTRAGVAGMERLGASINKVSGQMVLLGAGGMALGSQLTAQLAKPIGAFVRLDDAITDLQVSMMGKDGGVAKGFEEIKRQAIELGNTLPGTTADFVKVSTALLQQGTAVDALIGGGFKAAAHLSVVLKMPGEQAGEMVAKLREAYGLADNELGVMADKMQRARFAFGMKPDELKVAASYNAPTLNILGIKGEANLTRMLAMQGMAANVGLEGSSFGTNFAMMMTRLAKGPLLVAEAKKGMKVEAREIMEQMGVTFEFFDKKGKFKGLEDMISELEKLKLIKEKLGEKAALEVADSIFGTEAGRPAMILGMQGKAGFEEAMKKMEAQANLTQRLDRITKSTSNTWSALTGSIENALALLAEPAVEWAKPMIVSLNTGVAKLGEFTEKHKDLAKWTMIVVGGFAGFLTVVGALSIALGVMGKIFGGPISLMGKLFGKKGGAAGAIAGALTAQHVFVTNWPGSFGGIGGGATLPNGKPKPSSRLPKGGGMGNAATGIGAAAAGATGVGALWAALKTRTAGASAAMVGAAKSAAVSVSSMAAGTGKLGTAFTAAKGLAGKGGAVWGKVAMPLQVGMAVMSAGTALASTTASKSDKGKAVGDAMGGLAGGIVGAKLGAAIGTVIFPGIGTVIGGILGGLAGGAAGSWAGGKAGKAAVSDGKPVPVVVREQVATKPVVAPKPPTPIEIKVDYKPNVIIHGDPTPQSIAKFGEMLKAHQLTLEGMLKRVVASHARTAF